MKKLSTIIIMLAAIGVSMLSCNQFLDVPPKGVVSEDILNTPENVEKLVTAAYSSLGNDHWVVPYTSLWPYGSVRSDNAYKGGLGTSDQGGYHTYEIFSTVRTDEDKGNRMWTRIYIGVQRANVALTGISKLNEEIYPLKVQRLAEMRFIRGHFHFLLKILFKNIPYIDESIPDDSLQSVSNGAYSDDELWNKIAEDFQFAADNLKPSSAQAGRPNSYTAKAYLAKLRLYQAYQQDEQNNVININQDLLNEVVRLADEVITSGQYGLSDNYAENYLWTFENGKESIFAVQRSMNDGTAAGRIDMSTALNYPMYPAYGCCSFHRPSQNLVNAFQTNEDGIPKFDTYNMVEMKDPADFQNNSFDPRLDHTVGIPSHPYKYQLDVVYDIATFTRGPELYGPFSAMKEAVQVDCPCLTKAKGYAYPASSKNNTVIKFDDVLLWKAEALIELGRQNEALPIINKIRERAANSTDHLQYANGNYFSNYKIEPYKPGENIDWNQDNARTALRWERRLEFAMEGVRFFDLVRWGIAAEVMNKYFEVEKTRRTYLKEAYFTKNRDEYLPIPQQQLDLSQGVYKQNNGWN